MTDLILHSLKNKKNDQILIRFNGKVVDYLKDQHIESENSNGWFERFETGVLSKKVMLICIFCYKGEVFVSFEENAYNVKNLRFFRYFIFTRIKRFKAYYKGVCVVSFNYIYRYFEDHPLDESDFLYELDSIIKNHEQRKRLKELWNS